MPAAPHVIQRQHLRLRLAPGADGRAVQQRATAAFQNPALILALDAALSAAGPPDVWLTLDHLEIDLGPLDSAQLDRQLLARLPDLLRHQVADALAATRNGAASETAAMRTAGSTTWMAWLHFLEHGTLPSHWPTPASSEAWEAELQPLLAAPTEGQRTLLRALMRQHTARERLVRQFSGALSVAVLAALDASARPHAAALAGALAALLRRQRHYPGTLGERLLAELLRRAGLQAPPDWPALLAVLTPPALPSQPEALAQLARTALALARTSAPLAEQPAEPVAPAPAEATFTGPVSFVANAGIVLLHPFLPQCFAACGWLRDGRFITASARGRAALLLHFLATGATQAAEHELQLPKLLCGIPAGTALNRRWRLSRPAQAEGLALLTAAIEHWAALKNTTPDGLREAFLQREGKLEPGPDGDHHILTVEQRAQDVLLDRLPYGWGLGVVQLPWMPARLCISWA